MRRQEQRHAAGCHRRRLRRAAAEEAGVVDETFRVLGVGGAAGSPQAADVGAGRGEIGVAHAVAAARPCGDREAGPRWPRRRRPRSDVGSLAGESRPAASAPRFPAAVTTTMPASHARSSAAASGSVACDVPRPLSKATVRTSMSSASALATTQSTARPSASCDTAPSRPATLTDTMPASGATPRKSASRPAMMPARWVPCPKPSRPASAGSLRSALKSTAATTLPGLVSAGTGAMPVSMMATLTPAPVMPASHSSRAPI